MRRQNGQHTTQTSQRRIRWSRYRLYLSHCINHCNVMWKCNNTYCQHHPNKQFGQIFGFFYTKSSIFTFLLIRNKLSKTDCSSFSSSLVNFISICYLFLSQLNCVTVSCVCVCVHACVCYSMCFSVCVCVFRCWRKNLSANT